MTNKETQTLKLMLLGIVLWMIPISVIGVIIVQERVPFIFGVFAGSGVSVLLLLHMQYTITQALKRTKAGAEKYAVSNYFLRSFVTLGILMAAIFWEHLDIVGTLLGLLTMKGAAFVTPKLERYFSRSQ